MFEKYKKQVAQINKQQKDLAKQIEESRLGVVASAEEAKKQALPITSLLQKALFQEVQVPKEGRQDITIPKLKPLIEIIKDEFKKQGVNNTRTNEILTNIKSNADTEIELLQNLNNEMLKNGSTLDDNGKFLSIIAFNTSDSDLINVTGDFIISNIISEQTKELDIINKEIINLENKINKLVDERNKISLLETAKRREFRNEINNLMEQLEILYIKYDQLSDNRNDVMDTLYNLLDKKIDIKDQKLINLKNEENKRIKERTDELLKKEEIITTITSQKELIRKPKIKKITTQREFRRKPKIETIEESQLEEPQLEEPSFSIEEEEIMNLVNIQPRKNNFEINNFPFSFVKVSKKTKNPIRIKKYVEGIKIAKIINNKIQKNPLSISKRTYDFILEENDTNLKKIFNKLNNQDKLEISKIYATAGTYNELDALRARKKDFDNIKLQIIENIGESYRTKSVGRIMGRREDTVTGFGIKKQTKQPKYRQTKSHPYKILNNRFGDLVINEGKLTGYRQLHVKKGGRIIFNQPADTHLIDLLTKRYDSRKKYNGGAIDMFKKLVELANLPINPNSKKYILATTQYVGKNKVGKGCDISSDDEYEGGKVDMKIYSSPVEMVQRMGGIIASMNAGNTSKLLRNELRNLSDKLLEIGSIKKPDHKFVYSRYGLN